MIKRTFSSGDYLLVWSSSDDQKLDSVMLYRVENGTLTKIDQAYCEGQEIDDMWEDYKSDIRQGNIHRCGGEWGQWFFG